MKTTRNEKMEAQLLQEVFDELFPEDQTRIAPSTTDLIYCLTKSFLNKHNPTKPDRKTQMFFLLGIAVENGLLRTRKHPTVGRIDGISFHMDSLDYDNHPLDIKSTRMGIKTPENFPQGWIKQLMAYSVFHKSTTAAIAVVYLIPAELQYWDFEFEQDELDVFWEWLKLRRDDWNDTAGEGVMPRPFTFNEDYECKNCQYLTICKVTDARNNLLGI